VAAKAGFLPLTFNQVKKAAVGEECFRPLPLSVCGTDQIPFRLQGQSMACEVSRVPRNAAHFYGEMRWLFGKLRPGKVIPVGLSQT